MSRAGKYLVRISVFTAALILLFTCIEFSLIAGGRPADEIEGLALKQTIPANTAVVDEFGACIDISCDGKTMVVGSRYGKSAYVYYRATINDSWTLVKELSLPTPANGFGACVAISPDGNVIAVNGYFNEKSGYYVFIYSKAAAGEEWHANPGSTMLPNDFFECDLGSHPVMDRIDLVNEDNGDYVLAAAQEPDDNVAIWKSADNGNSFFNRTNITVDSPSSVAISGNGDEMAVGSLDNSIVHVFVKDHSGMIEEWDAGDEATVLSILFPNALGFGVAVNYDGSVIAGSDPLDESVYVYNRPAGGWANGPSPFYSDAELVKPDISTTAAAFGNSVNISKNGDYIAVGGPYDNIVAAYRADGEWDGGYTPFTYVRGDSGTRFGQYVAVDCDFNSIVVGATEADGKLGKVFEYQRRKMYSISGEVTHSVLGDNLQDVEITVTTTNGPPPEILSDITDQYGQYLLYVFEGWSGTFTASKTSFLFSPDEHSYSNVSAASYLQNFEGREKQLPVKRIEAALKQTVVGNTSLFGQFGHCIDMSCDGKTMVVGSGSDSSAYIYERDSVTDRWSKVREITVLDDYPILGQMLALSPDGDVIAVYGYNSSGSNYKVFIYSKAAAGGTWNDGSGNPLLPNDSIDCPLITTGLPIKWLALHKETNGNYTLAVAWWSYGIVEMHKSTNVGVSFSHYVDISTAFPSSLAFSGDGQVLVVGSSTNQEVYVYAKGKSGDTEDWDNTDLAATLAVSESSILGYNVAVNSDGSVIAASSPNNEKVYVYQQSTIGILAGPTTNILPDAELIKPDDITEDFQFGKVLDMNSDGDYIVVGGPADGIVSIYHADTWSGQCDPISVIKGDPDNSFGNQVAVDCDFSTILVGAIDAGDSVGVVYSYQWRILYLLSGSVNHISSGSPLQGISLTATTTNGRSPDIATTSTDANGNYCFYVYEGWSGKTIPSKTDYLFWPEEKSFSNINTAHSNQDFKSRELLTFSISASAGPGGSISPSGTVYVKESNNQLFRFTPAPNYKIKTVWKNGINIGKRDRLFFGNVNSNGSVRVEFELENSGWLDVDIEPKDAVAQGAGWRIAGTNQWMPGGTSVRVDPGDYTLEFKDTAGWYYKGTKDVTVQTAKKTSVGPITYTSKEITGFIRQFYPSCCFVNPDVGMMLHWMIDGVDQGSITELGNVNATGSGEVFPENDTDYELSANNSGTATVHLQTVKGPVVDWFITENSEVNPIYHGQSAEIKWQTAGTVDIELQADTGSGFETVTNLNEASGSYAVSPEETTEYKLVGIAGDQRVARTCTVGVSDKPRVMYFEADDQAIVTGQQTTISWGVVGTVNVEIEELNYTGSAKGKIVVAPGKTTTYKLTASNEAGTSTAKVKVVVENNGADLTVSAGDTYINGHTAVNLFTGMQNEVNVLLDNTGSKKITDLPISILQDEEVVGSGVVDVIPAGKSISKRVSFTPIVNGDVEFTIKTDPDHKMAFENRSTLETTFTANVGKMDGPDIMIRNVILERVATGKGDGLIIKYELRNVGKKIAKDFQVNVSIDGVVIHSEAVSRLDRRTVMELQATVLIKNDKKVDLEIKVDPFGVLGEVNTVNNGFSEAFTVKEIPKIN